MIRWIEAAFVGMSSRRDEWLFSVQVQTRQRDLDSDNTTQWRMWGNVIWPRPHRDTAQQVYSLYCQSQWSLSMPTFASRQDILLILGGQKMPPWEVLSTVIRLNFGVYLNFHPVFLLFLLNLWFCIGFFKKLYHWSQKGFFWFWT